MTVRGLALLMTLTLLLIAGCETGPRIDESKDRFTESVKAAKRDLTQEEKEEFEAAWKILVADAMKKGTWGQHPDRFLGGALHGMTAREAIAKAKKMTSNFDRYVKKGPDFKGVE